MKRRIAILMAAFMLVETPACDILASETDAFEEAVILDGDLEENVLDIQEDADEFTMSEPEVIAIETVDDSLYGSETVEAETECARSEVADTEMADAETTDTETADTETIGTEWDTGSEAENDLMEEEYLLPGDDYDIELSSSDDFSANEDSEETETDSETAGTAESDDQEIATEESQTESLDTVVIEDISIASLEEDMDEELEVISESSEEITLYAVDEPLQEYLSVPDGFLQTYNLSGHTWSIVSGDSIEIDEAGTVSVAGTTLYYHQDSSGWWVGQTSPSGNEDEISYFNYVFGDSVILVDGSTYLTVHSVSYASYYAEKIMDDYLAANVTADMTEYEIAELCCQFVAGYDYSADASGYVSMIVTGGGDCWASTAALVYMLQKEGITCASRDASSDAGAGSRHVNVMALLDGDYYILDAGYTGTAPRTYTMERQDTSSIYIYKKVYSEGTTGIYITGLILDDGSITELSIPETIDGYTVTGIADGAFSCNHNITTVYLPDTITYLGSKAFYQNYGLETIRLSENLQTIGANCFAWDDALQEIDIPASVTTITSNVFCYCDSLTAINVDEDNENFSSKDGVLFDKEMTTLLIFPAGKSNSTRPSSFTPSSYLSQLESVYTVPDGVQCIQAWAFAGVDLYSVVFPDSVVEIQQYAFYNTYIYLVELPSSLTTVSTYSFYDCSANTLIIPDSVTAIESYAFFRSSFKTIALSENIISIGEGAFAGIGTGNGVLKVPASVKEIGSYAFWFMYGWSSLDASSSDDSSTDDLTPLFFARGCEPDSVGDSAFTSTVLCVYENSYMHSYAVSSDISWYLVNSEGKVELQSTWLKGTSSSTYTYTGSAIEPTVSWKTSDGTCPFGIPSNGYQLSYTNNINIGTSTASVTVTGTGLFSGTISTSFSIKKADPLDDIIDRSGCGLQYSIEDGEVRIVSYIESTLQADLTIPETMEGYPVTAISSYAFQNCTILNSITIPSTVTSIASGAFTGCSNLTSVYYKGSITDWIAITGSDSISSILGEAVLQCETKVDVSNLTFTLSEDSYGYDGNEKKPSVRVKNGTLVLTEGTDYNISYQDNVNVGTARAIITGTGYYTGTKEITFEIIYALSAPEISLVHFANEAMITWNVISGAEGYRIYRKSENETSYTLVYTDVVTVNPASKRAWTDKSIISGVSYTYQVFAYSGDYISAGSNEAVLYASTDTSDSSTVCTISKLKNTANGIRITWNQFSEATGYYIYRKTASGSYKKIKEIQSGTKTSYTDKTVKNSNGVTLTYKIVPITDAGTASGSEKKIVRLTGSKISGLKNSSSNKIKVKWKKSSKVTGYQIQYSTSKTFKSGNKTVKVSGAKKTGKVLTRLKSGKTYYVRIRTYKKVSGVIYYSAWSSKKKVKVSE